MLRRAGTIAGVSAAAIGFVMYTLHALGAALTEHVWGLISQGLLFGGGLLTLAQLWGSPRRSRR